MNSAAQLSESAMLPLGLPKTSITTGRPSRALSARATPHLETRTGVVVLGRDASGKAHASWFGAEQVEKAEEAAAFMDMAILPVDEPRVAAIAGKLPKGKVFASGRAFVPFVKEDTYRELVTHLPKSQLNGTGGKASEQSAASVAPSSEAEDQADARGAGWATIKLGTLVLATEAKGEGWWEATVTEVKGDDMLVLKWRDWPDEDNFVRRRRQVALLHPDYRAA